MNSSSEFVVEYMPGHDRIISEDLGTYRCSPAIFVLTQPSRSTASDDFLHVAGISPTFCSHEEPSFSIMTTLERRISQSNLSRCGRVGTCPAYVLAMFRGVGVRVRAVRRPRRALLTLLRLKYC